MQSKKMGVDIWEMPSEIRWVGSKKLEDISWSPVIVSATKFIKMEVFSISIFKVGLKTYSIEDLSNFKSPSKETALFNI